MTAQVTDEPFDPWRSVADYIAARPALKGKHGATSVFVGTMRDVNAGTTVRAMTLEQYPAMTGAYLEKLCLEANARWDLLDMLLIHRCGHLRPDDPIVLVAVWAAHRRDAMNACRYLIEELKMRAPFWSVVWRSGIRAR